MDVQTLHSTGSSSQCGAECYTVELYEKTSAGRETMNMALRLLAARATADEAKTVRIRLMVANMLHYTVLH